MQGLGNLLGLQEPPPASADGHGDMSPVLESQPFPCLTVHRFPCAAGLLQCSDTDVQGTGQLLGKHSARVTPFSLTTPCLGSICSSVLAEFLLRVYFSMSVVKNCAYCPNADCRGRRADLCKPVLSKLGAQLLRYFGTLFWYLFSTIFLAE